MEHAVWVGDPMTLADISVSTAERELLSDAMDVFFEEFVKTEYVDLYKSKGLVEKARYFNLKEYLFARSWCTKPSSLSASLKLRRVLPIGHYKS